MNKTSPAENLFRIAVEPEDPARILEALDNPGFSSTLSRKIYPGTGRIEIEETVERFRESLLKHVSFFGPGKVILLRAPGRLNLFAEYLDMCAGDHMSVSMNRDIPAVVSLPEEPTGRVRIANCSLLFPGGEFSIEEELRTFSAGSNDRSARGWEEQSRLHPHRGRSKGDPVNYILAPFLRMAWQCPGPALRGVDITIGPSTLPVRGGVSSSSATLILGFLALWLANKDRLPPLDVREVCRLLGEAEWYVGTRGGANDQTTILRGTPGGILYNLHHLPLLDTRFLPRIRGIGIILCDSLWQADKAVESNVTFNLRKGWIVLGEAVLERLIGALCRAAGEDRQAVPKRSDHGSPWIAAFLRTRFGFEPGGPFPHLEADPTLLERTSRNLKGMGSLDASLLDVSWEVVSELASLLPSSMTPAAAAPLLGMSRNEAVARFAVPGAGDAEYRLRRTARFFMKENRLSRRLEQVFLEAHRRLRAREIVEKSEEYDTYRQKVAVCIDALQDTLREDFEVSIPHLDRLVEIARRGPGALAAKLTGAGGGGCVCILIRKKNEQAMLRWLDESFYGNAALFDDYRRYLDPLLSSTDPQVRERAAGMVQRLDDALKDPTPHRFALHVSQGAGAIDTLRFARLD